MNSEKRGRNRRATELFEEFMGAHCQPCLRARREKKGTKGWRPRMDACPRCGAATGRVFAAFLEAWRPEIVEYARTRRLECLGPAWGWEDLVSEFEMTLARSWYAGFTPGQGNLVHYMWRAVHNTWTRVISTAFRKRNTIEREQAKDDTGRYTSGVPSASVTSPLDAADEGGEAFAEQLPDPAQPEPGVALGNAVLAAEVRDRILSRLNPLDQAVFWDLLVNSRLEPARFAEEHLVTLATVKRRMGAVREVVAEVAEEYRGRIAP